MTASDEVRWREAFAFARSLRRRERASERSAASSSPLPSPPPPRPLRGGTNVKKAGWDRVPSCPPSIFTTASAAAAEAALAPPPPSPSARTRAIARRIALRTVRLRTTGSLMPAMVRAETSSIVPRPTSPMPMPGATMPPTAVAAFVISARHLFSHETSLPLLSCACAFAATSSSAAAQYSLSLMSSRRDRTL